MDHDRAPAAPRARLTEPGSPVCTPDWLALREPADHEARSAVLAGELDAALGAGSVVIRDLGCGTGSMGRWLAPRLHRPQRWYVHDRDADLAHHASAALPEPATPVVGNVTEVDLGGTDVVVCSALLDLLTGAEIERLADACAAAGAAVLWTLTVSGRVLLDPADPWDDRVAAAFDAHQRRDALAGPDASDLAVAALEHAGYAVRREASPWRLAAGESLAEEWVRGWVDAAAVQEPALAADLDAYLGRRLAQPFAAEVGHVDLLGLPR
ncbi:methyltransferase domain-containing protein [Actinomycetospora termitidis]|uniref:Class I SAM-dependent methyltransferase n=1 Tax=Actinomycetospora termitidis TaxID=3053470 RepID=A0ABT7M7E5_9PSEU|nr:class I SAM-dependent methyltransferase [Actinomycetospora sp. Odt1-22]MDL5156592.1 class I SAM-dependent methyltransferase [Actinomycetospora sp. Odt1-22]